ncbi:MAG: TonB-dependent siderophore receptor, partial [Pseudomonadota bacterium]
MSSRHAPPRFLTPPSQLFARRAIARALTPLAFGAALAPVLVGAPLAAFAQPADPARVYGIPAGPLEAALAQFGRESGLMLSFTTDTAAGLRSPGLQGSHTARSGLDALLAGTGVDALPQPNGSYVLRRRAAAPAPDARASSGGTLAEVQVRADGIRETATSPVIGYRAQRAASANKTDTPVSETPQSISVVTRDQITDQGANTLQEALAYAAGVRADIYGLDTRADSATIRGSDATTYIDGLRQTNDYYTSTTRPDAYTLERIEVLRGPSAMLYGQGSTGGVINLVSKRPQEDFQGEVGVQLGNYGRKQFQADLTGPLTADGAWLYRLVAVARDADTQVDHVRDDRMLLMPSITWRPSAATSLTFQGLYQKDKSGSTSQFLPWSGMLTANPNGMIPTSRFIGEPGDHYDSERSTLGYLFEHKFNDQWTVRQNVRYAANKNDYLTHYADSFTVPGGWAADPINQRLIGRYGSYDVTKVRVATADQHLQGKLQTGDVQHTLLAGVDLTRYRKDARSAYGYDTIDAYAPVYGLAAPLELGDNLRSRQRQTGVYLQDQMKLGQNWIVVAGLRHDRVVNSVEGSDDDKSQATTKRLGLMYQLANGWSPYASYSESFSPVAGTNFYGERYKPLEGAQVETGVKYMPADGRTQFTAAIYR